MFLSAHRFLTIDKQARAGKRLSSSIASATSVSSRDFLLFWSLDAQGHGIANLSRNDQVLARRRRLALWGWRYHVVRLLLFIGASGKSAQIPLHVGCRTRWLDRLRSPH